MPRLSVVIPVFNEEDNLAELRSHLAESLEAGSGGYELVLVDDGSSDRSAAIVEGWAAEDPRVVLVQLSRNFGMELAMSAGLDYASGDYVALMQAPTCRTRPSCCRRCSPRRRPAPRWSTRGASAATRAASSAFWPRPSTR